MSTRPSNQNHPDEQHKPDERCGQDEPGERDEPFDLVGVGLGPFNLSLAALADGLPRLRTRFFEARPGFSWHPGLLLPGTRLQVPFLADPTSRWSFLSYLHAHDRLFRFYFHERFHLLRQEYDDYCRWVATGLAATRFGSRVDALRWRPDTGLFEVEVSAQADGHTLAARTTRTVLARNIVLGVGTEPSVPAAFTGLLGPEVFHSAEYRTRRAALAGAGHVTVVGSGQSGAEVFLDLLRAQPETGQTLHWITRTPAFAPMEYSKLGLEQFTPDYVRYFHGLDQPAKDALLPTQWQLYKGIDAETIAEIYDLLYERTVAGAAVDAALLPHVTIESGTRTAAGRIRLACRHVPQDRVFTVETDRVVLATGYAARRPTLLGPVADLLDLDDTGRYQVDAAYRLATVPRVSGRIYVQNAELHTHGVGTPDLGLGAWRAAVILDDLTDGTAYRVPPRSAFTTFGAPTDAPAPGPGPASGASRPTTGPAAGSTDPGAGPAAGPAVRPRRGDVPAPTGGGGQWTDGNGP
ncbi:MULTISPECIES: lysine N(6)-hydroxylase/L-ornithine N(5)-oxygenase family protein [Frankiaceae]|uniref:L-lysine N6-monooxygenase MbtG n=1 Tax=Candidatus Protofrankia datiscae TaxID=2716812 RepID=F8AVD7_9ACTN|nr:L-lysine 6-monooxygenase (NADPH) [Candidatus Protofrankia datiscae]